MRARQSFGGSWTLPSSIQLLSTGLIHMKRPANCQAEFSVQSLEISYRWAFSVSNSLGSCSPSLLMKLRNDNGEADSGMLAGRR